MTSVFLLLAPTRASATDFVWDGACEAFSTDWNQVCEGGGESNFQNGYIPSKRPDEDGGQVVIASGGPTTEIAEHFPIVDTVDIQSPLQIFLNRRLTVRGGGTIKDLSLFSTSRLGTDTVGNVNLTGATNLGGIEGAGEVHVQGTFSDELSTFDAVKVYLEGTGTLSLGSVGGISQVINTGSTVLDDFGTTVGGADGRLDNRSSLEIFANPPLEYSTGLVNSGQLDLTSGVFQFRGRLLDLAGGTLNLLAGTEFQVGSATYGAPVSRTVSQPSVIQGNGVFRTLSDVTVNAQLVTKLAVEPGFVLDSGLLDLQALLVNTDGWVTFDGGGIEGPSHLENNRAVRVLGGTAHATIKNNGDLSISGGGLALGENAELLNLGGVYAYADVTLSSGAARIVNEKTFHVEEISGPVTISPEFNNLAGGTLSVVGGVANLSDVGNLVGTTLVGGQWTVSDATLNFPGSITALDGAHLRLFSTSSIIPQLQLESISGGGRYEGPPLTGGTGLEVLENGWIKTSGIQNTGGTTIGAPGDPADDDPASPRAELSLFVIIARQGDGLTSPTLDTPLLTNHGRLVPGTRQDNATVTLAGNYVQAANGALVVEMGDLLAVDGDVTLAGTLEVRAEGATPGQQFTILTATGSLSGTFGSVLSEDEFTVLYFPQEVVVQFDSQGSGVFSDGFEHGDPRRWSAATE